MTNYSDAWRSNKFRVKDTTLFAVWAQEWPEMSYRCYKDNMVSISDNGANAGLPYFKEIEAENGTITYVDQNIDFLSEIADHVDETSVAIIIQSGFDDRRLVEGYATAITGGDATLKDRVIELSLFDIEEMAKRKFGKRPLPFNDSAPVKAVS